MRFLNMFFNLLNKDVVTTTTANGGDLTNITFEPANFLDMLYYMGIGMLVIFVLIGAIILVTMLINKIFSKK